MPNHLGRTMTGTTNSLQHRYHSIRDSISLREKIMACVIIALCYALLNSYQGFNVKIEKFQETYVH